MRRPSLRIGSAALLTFLVASASAAPPAPSDFVLFGDQGVRAHGLTVQSGAVGTNGALVATRRVDASKSTLAGATVTLDPASSCQMLLANAGGGAPLCGPAQPVTLPVIADVASACGAPSQPPASCSGGSIEVPHGATTVLNPQTYGSIKVSGGGAGPGTLILNAGNYTICGDVRVARQAKILARGAVTITVLGSLRLENGSVAGPESASASPCTFHVVVEGTRARVSRRGQVRGIVCAPNAAVELAAGSDVHGAFFARTVKTDRANVTLVGCSGTTSTTTATTTSTHQTTTTTTATTTTTTSSHPTTSSTSTTTTPTTSSSSTSVVGTTSSSSTSTIVGTTSTSSTTTVVSTSSTSSSTSAPPTTSSTSTPATTSSTTSTFVGAPATAFDFLSTVGTGVCGQTFRDTNLTVPLKNLLCGNLSLGGGQSTVPDNVTPAGATNRFKLTCTGADCTVGAVATAGAGFDCSATGCRFGTPLPIANGALSVCVENAFSQDVTGTLDRSTGSTTLDFELRSRTILTTLSTQPCPLCRIGSLTGAPCAGTPDAPCTGVCEGSPNQGAACVSTNPSGLTGACPAPTPTAVASKCYKGSNNNNICVQNSDCPGGGACAQFVGDIPISLNPLSTGTQTKLGPGATFCPGQTSGQAGAFKTDICRLGTNSGKPCTSAADCPGGSCRSGTLVNYCSAGTNSGLGCATASECGTGGVCAKAGTLAQAIKAFGTPAGPLTSTGVATPIKLATVFCVAETQSAPVNSSSNLPGPGATALAGTIKLIP